MVDSGSTTFPDGITLDHAQLPASARRPRPTSLLILAAIMFAALTGLFGGAKVQPITVDSPQATLMVHTNRVLRNGLLFETRIHIAAHTDLADATLLLPPSLWRDMTINSTEPQAASEDFEHGAFRFHYGKLAAGDRLDIKIDGQVNPPLFGGTQGYVALADGDNRLITIPLTITVLP